MTDELDDVREKEEANYQISVKVLGDSVSLVQDLLDVHALKERRVARQFRSLLVQPRPLARPQLHAVVRRDDSQLS